MDKLLAKIEKLEYHQQLLLKMIRSQGHEFDRMIIEKNMGRDEVQEFFALCEEMSVEIEKQKAEKFVFYTPLFYDFLNRLNPKLDPLEVVEACLGQNVYPELMTILKKHF